MFACGCASPDCMVNGCAAARRWRQAYYPAMNAPMPSLGQFTAPPITEERMRELIREELERTRFARI